MQCTQAKAKIEQLDNAAKDYRPPEFIFSRFEERAELAAVFIVPPLLVYALGAVPSLIEPVAA